MRSPLRRPVSLRSPARDSASSCGSPSSSSSDRSARCHRSVSSADADRPLELLVSSDAETLDPRLRDGRRRHASHAPRPRGDRPPRPRDARTHALCRALVAMARRTRRWRSLSAKGVRFHGGSLLSSSDVVATLRAFASPAVASRHAGVVDAIASVEADGPSVVRITLRRPTRPLLTDLELPMLARRSGLSSSPSRPACWTASVLIASNAGSQGEILLSPAEDAALPRPRRAVFVRTVMTRMRARFAVRRSCRHRAQRHLADAAAGGREDRGPSRSRPGPARTSRTWSRVWGAHLSPTSGCAARSPRASTEPRLRARCSRARGAGGHSHGAGPLGVHALPGPLAFDPAGARRALQDAGLSGVHLTPSRRLIAFVCRSRASSPRNSPRSASGSR